MRRLLMIAAPMILVLVVGTTAAADSVSGPGRCKAPPVPFEESRLIVETNATDATRACRSFSAMIRGGRLLFARLTANGSSTLRLMVR